MSATRPARDDEVPRIWPAVKAARIFGSAEELSAYRDAGPWRVRVSEAGDAMVLGAWRADGDTLWIRGLWPARSGVGELVGQAIAVARSQGFDRVLSPLVPADEFGGYREGGMEPVESIVALQGLLATLADAVPPAEVAVRLAVAEDTGALLRLDRACFDAFWAYGPAEFESVTARERLTVAVSGGEVVGYSTLAAFGPSATLGRIAVGTAYRGRGVARALIAEQAAWASRRGSSAMVLCTQETNAAARALYRACGMVELPTRYTIGSVTASG